MTIIKQRTTLRMTEAEAKIIKSFVNFLTDTAFDTDFSIEDLVYDFNFSDGLNQKKFVGDYYDIKIVD